jgi:hypothetical protein
MLGQIRALSRQRQRLQILAAYVPLFDARIVMADRPSEVVRKELQTRLDNAVQKLNKLQQLSNPGAKPYEQKLLGFYQDLLCKLNSFNVTQIRFLPDRNADLSQYPMPVAPPGDATYKALYNLGLLEYSDLVAVLEKINQVSLKSKADLIRGLNEISREVEVLTAGQSMTCEQVALADVIALWLKELTDEQEVSPTVRAKTTILPAGVDCVFRMSFTGDPRYSYVLSINTAATTNPNCIKVTEQPDPVPAKTGANAEIECRLHCSTPGTHNLNIEITREASTTPVCASIALCVYSSFNFSVMPASELENFRKTFLAKPPLKRAKRSIQNYLAKGGKGRLIGGLQDEDIRQKAAGNIPFIHFDEKVVDLLSELPLQPPNLVELACMEIGNNIGKVSYVDSQIVDRAVKKVFEDSASGGVVLRRQELIGEYVHSHQREILMALAELMEQKQSRPDAPVTHEELIDHLYKKTNSRFDVVQEAQRLQDSKFIVSAGFLRYRLSIWDKYIVLSPTKTPPT